MTKGTIRLVPYLHSSQENFKGENELLGRLFDTPIGVAMITMKSFLVFEDLKEPTLIRMDLPSPIPIGTPINLSFCVMRRNRGRSEELRIQGTYKVTHLVLEQEGKTFYQKVSLVSTGIAPSWRAVKKPIPRKLAPTRSPKTEVL